MTAPVYELTVFAEDDASVLFRVGTARTHSRPYLKVPQGFPEQEVDFAQGAVSIGQMTLHVVDVYATSQASGYITSVLAGAGGYSALTGHRARVTENTGGGLVLDGVIRSIRLLDSWSAYEFEIRDIRERERKTRAFTRTDTPTILPRGVLNGYGIIVQPTPQVMYPVPATAPLVGTYSASGPNTGTVTFTGGAGDEAARTLTPAMREAFASTRATGLGGSTLLFDRFKILWRPIVGVITAYEELTDLIYYAPIFPQGTQIYTDGGTGIVQSLRLDNIISGGTLPDDGQDIQVIVQYDGPVTEDWPLHIQGVTAGELLRDLYDGVYSDEAPRIRYDEDALLALDTPVMGRIKEPADDLREWAEKNVYPVVHAAPTLDAAGRISPTTYLVPDDVGSLPDLSDANCRPLGGGWHQASEDIVNVVRVTYQREYASTEHAQDPDTISSREVIVEHQIPGSLDFIGERSLEISSSLLTAIGDEDGVPYFKGDPEETGRLVAERIAQMAMDRLALGGQYFDVAGSRADSDVEALRPGSWATVSASWVPEYATGERGASKRLAQVIRRVNLNAAWCALTLIDSPDRSGS